MPPSDFTDTNQNETPSLKATPNFLTSPVNYTSHHVQSLLLKILKQGPIPQHIGFIMDGNRRFARKMNYKQVVEGHFMGYDKLQEVLNICLHLGVKVVTIYAFSIENFKRPKEEVDTLMELAKTKFIELCEKSHLVNKYDLCVRILGNIALLPVDVQDAAKKAVETTKNNTGSILNICVPYTSRDEITSSIKSVIKSVENGHMQIRDINEEIIEKCLYTYGSPPLNILIRTSGEIRLSDFLLWQCHKNCYIHFVDCFWPEFSLWEMLPIILEYQLSHNSLKLSIYWSVLGDLTTKMFVSSNDSNSSKPSKPNHRIQKYVEYHYDADNQLRNVFIYEIISQLIVCIIQIFKDIRVP